MAITLSEQGSSRVLIVWETDARIETLQDALDLMMTARVEYDCDKLLIAKDVFCSDFYDLRSGLAGEVLQKFTNYGFQMAIAGDFSDLTSKALRDFIRESNRGNRFFFLPTQQEALTALHNL